MDVSVASVDVQLTLALGRLHRATDRIATCQEITRVAEVAAKSARIKLEVMMAANADATRNAERLQAIPIRRPVAVRAA